MGEDERRADEAGEQPPTEEPPPPPPPPAAATETAPPAPQLRRLTRSRDDRVIAGVCGGLGKYLGVDAVLVRIAALVLVLAGGAGLLLYLIGWIAMPEEPQPSPGEGVAAAGAPAPAGETVERRGALVLGLVFVALGGFFLVDEVWSDFLAWKYVWPIALIAVGLAIILRPRR